MFKITKVGVISLGKLKMMMSVFIGLIAGIVYSALVLTGVVAEISGLTGTILKFGAIVIFPMVGAIGGFILGMIAALIFNLAAKISGGLMLDIDEVEEVQKPNVQHKAVQAQQQMVKK